MSSREADGARRREELAEALVLGRVGSRGVFEVAIFMIPLSPPSAEPEGHPGGQIMPHRPHQLGLTKYVGVRRKSPLRLKAIKVFVAYHRDGWTIVIIRRITGLPSLKYPFEMTVVGA